ncbi:DUF1289 domain-containing protein [Limnohabitans sp.]|jgi:uncharacterized protein|uniref:DUF1289 domain-containing protein n=1 Tax=Limnohabitans sp. TaxID=1907725 RepID=UPI00262DC772|nr:DUF1289 domain-containing protein [Limnohabitans sp.]
MSQFYWKKLAERAAQVLAEPTPPAPNSVPSPCVSLCLMHPSAGWCDGCLRTLPEIGSWSRATDEEKRRVWELIPERLRQRQALEG